MTKTKHRDVRVFNSRRQQLLQDVARKHVQNQQASTAPADRVATEIALTYHQQDWAWQFRIAWLRSPLAGVIAHGLLHTLENSSCQAVQLHNAADGSPLDMQTVLAAATYQACEQQSRIGVYTGYTEAPELQRRFLDKLLDQASRAGHTVCNNATKALQRYPENLLGHGSTGSRSRSEAIKSAMHPINHILETVSAKR